MGDAVFFSVSQFKGAMGFNKSSKLAPRCIGPFEILDGVGLTVYQVTLLLALSRIHNIFHASPLRKYVPDPSHVLKYELVNVSEDLSY